MKGTHRIDVPLLSVDGEQDERSDFVILLSADGDEDKTTAEDCGDFWQVRDWEITASCEGPMWFCRFAYSIEKTLISKLWLAQTTK